MHKLRRTFPLFLLLLVACLAAPPASATHTTGTCTSTITTAVGDIETYLNTTYGAGAHATVCLTAGDYTSSGNRISLATFSDLTIRNVPGNVSRLLGQLRTAEDTDRVTFYGLELNGYSYTTDDTPTVLLTGDDNTFDRVTVSNGARETSCFHSTQTDPAIGTEIRNSRIYYCGGRNADGAEHDHGIYIGNGSSWLIEDNYIYENAGRGVQLYSDSDNNVVQFNVIAQNCAGGTACSTQVIYSAASDANEVEFNTIAYPYNGKPNVDTFQLTGVGNEFIGNCLWRSDGTAGNSIGDADVYQDENRLDNPDFSTDLFYGYQGGFMAQRNFDVSEGSDCTNMEPRGTVGGTP